MESGTVRTYAPTLRTTSPPQYVLSAAPGRQGVGIPSRESICVLHVGCTSTPPTRSRQNTVSEGSAHRQHVVRAQSAHRQRTVGMWLAHVAGIRRAHGGHVA